MTINIVKLHLHSEIQLINNQLFLKKSMILGFERIVIFYSIESQLTVSKVIT